MKKVNGLIKDLAEQSQVDKRVISNYITQLKAENNSDFDLEQTIKDYNQKFLVELFEKHLFSKDREFITAVLANKLSQFVKEHNLLLQFTKRSKFKQQQTLNDLEELPTYIENEYSKAATKILNWIEYSFISEETSKVVTDIQPGATIENQPIDLRVTLYEKNHPTDLNLIFKREPGSLKNLTWEELIDHLSCIKRINPDFEGILESASDFLENLANFLEENNDPKLIKKFFKRITASPSYYEILIEPEILIVDFSNIKLPSAIEVDYDLEKNTLYLDFDNQFNIKCELEKEEENSIFTVKFNDIPTDLELISL